ncbi:MAG TPA: efflux RND transporter permease subunit [Pedococcus sp.]|nr:efflux RND transporter permease subunit [Pedococcus sp.]
MGSLLRGALRFRVLVLAVALGVLGVGVIQLKKAPVDVLPEFAPPYAEIQTEALGLSASEVEQLVTVPLEADLLNGVEGVEVIRSKSLPGLSSIVLVFAPGSDIYRERQLVEERLTQAHALPNVSKPPTLLNPLSSSNRVLMIALSSDKLSGIEQSVIARWTMRPRLMGVPGVANVSVWGMRDQQLQVQVDPARLRDKGVTLNQVIESAGNAQVVSPLTFLEASTPGTGGFIESPQQRLQVRHLIEKIADPRELGKVPVEGTGGRLRLSDVSTIVVDHQPLIGDAVVNGGAGLMLVVEKFPGASTLEVTKGVEDALESLRPGLSGIQTDTSIFRPAAYIDDALGNLGWAVGIGFLLLLLVVAAILRWRAMVVALVTVPLSLVVAGLVLTAMGQSFNALVLAGLAAAVAVVVDEAVTPTHHVMRRLRAHQEVSGNGGRTTGDAAILAASREVRTPLVYATVIALLAVVPVAVLGGRPGDFFGPMVLAFALAVIAAMLVAVTVAPALSSFLFARWRPAGEASPATRPAGRARGAYLRALAWFSGRLRVPLVAAGACLVLGVAMLPLLHSSLIPTFKDQAVLVRLDGQPGTSNPRMTEVAAEIGDRIEAIPGVGSVGATIGRAVTGDRVSDVSSSDIWVSIDPDSDHDATLAAIKDAVRDTPGLQHEVVTYSAQKVRDVGAVRTGDNRVTGNGLDLLTGSDKPLVVRVFGENLDELKRQADRVQQVLKGVDGVVDPQVALPPVQPTVEIEVDLDKAQAVGITPGQVRRAEATLLQGIQVGSIFQEQKVFDVVVQGVPSTRASVDAIRNLLLDRPGGGHVRLGDVAEVRLADVPAVVERDAVSRRLDVVADVSGRSLDAVAADVGSRIAQMTFPIEYHAEVLEESTADEIGAARVTGFAVGVAIAVFLLLQAAFRSWQVAALLFALLPVSLTGGVVAVALQGGSFTLGSALGLLAALAFAVRTSMVLVAGHRTLDRGAQGPERADTVQRAAGDRLVPVLTSVAALVLLVSPVLVLGSRPGLEILQSMSVVLLGGLVTTVLVTLLVLPATYLHLPPRPLADEPDLGELERRAPDLARSGNGDGDAMPRQRSQAVDVRDEQSRT